MDPNRARPRRRRPLAVLAVGVLAAAMGSVSAPEAVASLAAQDTQEPGTITTVAGGLGDGAPATEVAIWGPSRVTLDPDGGGLYFSDTVRMVVQRIDLDTGVLTTVAGNGVVSPMPPAVDESTTGHWEVFGDGGPATEAMLRNPVDIVFDRQGDLYIADGRTGRIRKVDPETGIITTIAGNGAYNLQDFPPPPHCPRNEGGPAPGDGGPATEACLIEPVGLAIDDAGTLYIAEASGNRVRRIDPDTGVITTIAGTGKFRPSGSSDLRSPTDVVLDPAGGLVIAENDRVRRLDLATGKLSTVAAGLQRPTQVALDAAGNMFIAESGNNRVRRVDADTGTMTTFAGTGKQQPGPDRYRGEPAPGEGGPATEAMLSAPMGVDVDAAGNAYIAEPASWVRRVDADGIITTVGGNGFPVYGGDGRPGVQAVMGLVSGSAVDADGNLYVADMQNNSVRRVDADTGVITTVAGKYYPYFEPGYPGDGKRATEAQVPWASDVAVDAAGNLYIAEAFGHRIRKVDAETGIISTIAGATRTGAVHGITTEAWREAGYPPVPGSWLLVGDSEPGGFTGDGGPARAALLATPMGVDVDAAGNVYIADWGSCRVRKVDGLTGIITTVAGGGLSAAGVSPAPTCGFSGDGGPADQAELSHITDVVVDEAGNLYIADSGLHTGEGQPANNRVRFVDASTGIITTIAGTGEWDNDLRKGSAGAGDGGPATLAALSGPSQLAVDTAGTVFLADFLGHRVRRVDAATGVITTVAGTGKRWGLLGDGGLATVARLSWPNGVAIAPGGDLYLSDSGIPAGPGYFPENVDRIRKISGVAAG